MTRRALLIHLPIDAHAQICPLSCTHTSEDPWPRHYSIASNYDDPLFLEKLVIPVKAKCGTRITCTFATLIVARWKIWNVCSTCCERILRTGSLVQQTQTNAFAYVRLSKLACSHYIYAACSLPEDGKICLCSHVPIAHLRLRMFNRV